ncbi:ABC transporter permease subunit [Corynebacterium macginleyi]|uniref:Iron ABC transporter permease n=1 Tax=Corynebacterium macginleyi TaxID=38290 RepID=A0A3M0G954_9CORY|nr:iron ABC transporter permease [Corynebacterium macginleyi]MBK4140349.1 ABC transporter permease subunit [Corynebacterium macginleyi]MBK4143157.1 ABC transporter permease subunit [Corynebacterium macginleyi]MBK4150540.1 ABC transporter permease subunit [Corynebacterium macginleyi]MBK4152293.1 ABC transporter permease subunit [Corynebacterium macginleyi]MBK4156246.1 ABC transporter permease subunit [Corynebacterium macginleyi]
MNRNLLSIRSMLKSPLNIVVLIVMAYVLITFLIWPNLSLLLGVFRQNGEWSLDVFSKLFASERAMKSLRNSIILAFALCITVNVVGIFIVLVTRYFDIKGSRILFLGFATPLLYGGVVMVSAYNLIYGSNGYLTNAAARIFPEMGTNWFKGALAVILVMTFSGTGSHLLFLSDSISKIDYQTIEASKQMGASTWQTFRAVVLPVLRPMVFAITILTFLGGLGALTAPLILGGENFQTISPMILTFSRTVSSRDLAATLAMFLGVMTIIMLAILNRAEKGGTYFSVSKVPVALQKQKIDNPVVNAIVHFLAWLLWLIYVTPPVLIVIFSFTNASAISSGQIRFADFTLSNYARIFTDPAAIKPFAISLAYSAVASVVVVFAMLFVARLIQRHRNTVTIWLEYLLHIPWLLPGTMIALGLLLTFSTPQPLVFGQVLSGTVILLAIGYVIEKIPFTLRMLKASYTGVPDNLEEAGSLLGASEFKIFRKILLPIVLPVAAAITARNFNALLDDYDTAIFLAHPFYQPLGIFIYNATESDTLNDTTALTFVYTVLLMIISSLVLYSVYGRSSKQAHARRRFGLGWLRNIFRRRALPTEMKEVMN